AAVALHAPILQDRLDLLRQPVRRRLHERRRKAGEQKEKSDPLHRTNIPGVYRGATPSDFTCDRGGGQRHSVWKQFRPVAGDLVEEVMRWRIVPLVLVFVAFAHFNRVSISVAGAEQIIRPGFVSETEMGFVYSAFLLTYTLFMIPGGWFIDRFGPRAAWMIV